MSDAVTASAIRSAWFSAGSAKLKPVQIQPDGSALVDGIATNETVHHSGVQLSYDGSKDAFSEQNWPFRNIREQHDVLKAIGTAEEISFDDEARAVRVVSRITSVETDAIQKLKDNVYKAYSVGIEWFTDDEELLPDGTLLIHKYRLFELSIVDSPDNPTTTLTLFSSRHKEGTMSTQKTTKTQPDGNTATPEKKIGGNTATAAATPAAATPVPDSGARLTALEGTVKTLQANTAEAVESLSKEMAAQIMEAVTSMNEQMEALASAIRVAVGTNDETTPNPEDEAAAAEAATAVAADGQAQAIATQVNKNTLLATQTAEMTAKATEALEKSAACLEGFDKRLDVIERIPAGRSVRSASAATRDFSFDDDDAFKGDGKLDWKTAERLIATAAPENQAEMRSKAVKLMLGDTGK